MCGGSSCQVKINEIQKYEKIGKQSLLACVAHLLSVLSLVGFVTVVNIDIDTIFMMK